MFIRDAKVRCRKKHDRLTLGYSGYFSDSGYRIEEKPEILVGERKVDVVVKVKRKDGGFYSSVLTPFSLEIPVDLPQANVPEKKYMVNLYAQLNEDEPELAYSSNLQKIRSSDKMQLQSYLKG